MDHLSRRKFLKKTSQVSVGLMAAGALSSCQRAVSHYASPVAAPKVLGANERINLAVVGIRSRGWKLASGFAKIPNVHVKTLCDVDGNVLQQRAAETYKHKGYKPNTEKDFRNVLEDKDIDAVVLATPNFWHALGTIWACQAGKHVYVEKPCCHNIWEGRKMVEAARKYNVLVEVGFQNRSIENVHQAIKFLQEGGIGEVYMARGLCYKVRKPIGMPKNGIGPGPDHKYFIFNEPGIQYDQAYINNVDYDLWTGPADPRPFNYNRFHYNWHWQWNYGSGDIGNQGPHQFDIARWGLGKDEHPVKISSAGGYYGPPSHQETPNVQTANIEYADGKLLVFEVRGTPTNNEDKIKIGNLFFGTKGWMHINGGNWKTYFGYKNEPGPGSDSVDEFADPMNLAGAGSGGHQGNFIASIRSGKRSDLTCDIEEGYMSSVLPLMANISYRLGETLSFDGSKEKFVHNRKANQMLKRTGHGEYTIPENV